MAKRKKKAKSGADSPFLGRWRIVSMATESADLLGAEAGAHLVFERDGLGRFAFADLTGDVDYREVTREGLPAVEFTWEDQDGFDPRSGRGWAILEGDRIAGMIFLHMGDDAVFAAERSAEVEPEPAADPDLVDFAAQIFAIDPAARPTKSAKAGESAGTGKVYQLKVTLKDIRPPIWRRVLVPDVPLPTLHDILQIAMGWKDSHLHEFDFAGTHYSDPETAAELEWEEADGVSLGQLVQGEKFKFRYTYDFGDSWVHEVVVEKILDPEPGRAYPLCVAGKRSCPPEDVGGPWGYGDFAEAIVDPKHGEHARWSEWIGGFDPEAFSVDEVNDKLRRFL